MKKILFALVATALIQPAFAAPKLKTETITTQGQLGMIQEERVQSVQSEIRYVPNGFSGYTLIDTSDNGSDLDEHVDSGELAIPSWTLFSW
jgi:hypothetical protein